jgi:hypothetical protein
MFSNVFDLARKKAGFRRRSNMADDGLTIDFALFAIL